MGVYIPNIEIEKFYELCKQKGIELIAIPVPEHGDLIDKKDIVPKDGYIIADGMACVPVKDIVNAHAIIPADPPVVYYPQVHGITPILISDEGNNK